MRKASLIGGIALAAAASALVVSQSGPGRSAVSAAPAPRTAATTSSDGLERTIALSRARVSANPGDGDAAVVLADALMRAARVRSDATLAVEAEQALRGALHHGPADYGVRRMLGVVYLSQHRFAEALAASREATSLRPEDAWNYAVAGDALLELGRYEEAFDAFDEVVARRPDAAAYARIAYARELQGDLEGAVQLMQMASEATAPPDLEARAWTFAQVGNLYLLQHRLDDAEREFKRADFMFPGHPYATNGFVRLHIARGQHRLALQLVERAAETPESLALRGDLLRRLGDVAAAEASYRRAEQVEREGWKFEEPQPAALARFLSDRGRDTAAAVSLAETAALERQDIQTLDALAWAYFRDGRLEEAFSAIKGATRTGTVDTRIRCHEGAISAARARGVWNEDACDPLSLVAGVR